MPILIEYLRSLSRRHFVRNVFTVASGTAGVQLIGAMFAPILTRQYGPAAYGVLGAFMALSAVLTNVAGLTYPLAMVLPRQDICARRLAALSLVVAAALSGLLAATLWIFRERTTKSLGLAEVDALVVLLPLTIFLITTLSVSRQWLIRKGRFSAIAVAGVGQALLANSAKVAVGLWAPTATVLVTVGALAPGLYVLLLMRNVRDLFPLKHMPATRRRLVTEAKFLPGIARAYKDFPLYRAPQHLLNSLGFAVPTLLLASTFGASAAGYYAITQTVMGLPSMLIGKSVGDVFYPRVAAAIRSGRRIDLELKRATLILIAAGLIPFGLIVLTGPSLFEFVFGDGWAQAGYYAQWLAPLFLLNLANKPSVAAVAPMGLQGKLLLYEVMATAAKCGGFLVGFVWFGIPIAAVALFSAAGSAAYIALIIYIICASQRLKNEKAG